MGFRQDYAFWHLANYLVEKKDYRIINYNQNLTEIWLENRSQKNFQLIRLFRYDLDWKNWLKNDQDQALIAGEKIRRKMRKGKLQMLNLYVSTYPPVDDYEILLEKPIKTAGRQATSATSLIISSDNLQNSIKEFNDLIKGSYHVDLENTYEESDVIEMKQTAIRRANEGQKEEENVFNYGRPLYTYLFIGIQVIVFLIMELMGGSTDIPTLLAFGAKFNPFIIEGEWWRFFTPIFIHIGLLHLFMNTLALYYLGTAVERIFGNNRFLFIYTVAGVGGTIASFAFSTSISAGASGAIFGCFGALLYFGLVKPGLFFRTMGMNVLVVIGINLVLGFTIPMIDNAGHLGGLIGGFLATAVVGFPKRSNVKRQLLSLALMISLAVGLLYSGFTFQADTLDERTAIVIAQDAIGYEDHERAYTILKDYLRTDDDVSIDFHFTLAYVELNLSKYEEAKERYLNILLEEEEFPEVHYYLAVIYFSDRDLDNTLKHIDRAIELEPNNKEFQIFKDNIDQYVPGPHNFNNWFKIEE